MIGLYVTVPVACFRKGLAREYLETELLPPPSTCYGFLLSLVGETNRTRHIGCRVTPGLLGQPAQSVVLRTVWRVKKTPLGSSGNTRPDYQQLLTGIEALIWLDSSGETHENGLTLEDRVATALQSPDSISRFGGLSFGESTHLVDEVCLLDGSMLSRLQSKKPRSFLLHPTGRVTLPVWVDHVGSSGTRYVVGNIVDVSLEPPPLERMSVIEPLSLPA
jgi:CRISPR-associated protein Cas5t